jgi:rhodanese-related sulfurtransferase
MTTITQLLKSKQASIIDVRTPEEFMGGHVAGSINIPLNQLPNRLQEVRQHQNVVLCCASGGRSGSAAQYLKQNNIECVNAGSWLDVNYLINN